MIHHISINPLAIYSECKCGQGKACLGMHQGNELYWKCNQKDTTKVQSVVELNQAVLSGLSL